jgi:hypothetical protein
MCSLLRGGNHKIADTAALQFRGTLDHQERIRCNASFDTSCAGRLLGHGEKCSCMILYGILLHNATCRGRVGSNTRFGWAPQM